MKKETIAITALLSLTGILFATVLPLNFNRTATEQFRRELETHGIGFAAADVHDTEGGEFRWLDMTKIEHPKLEELKAVKVDGLILDQTTITNLVPLTRFHLKVLSLNGTPVADLAPLKAVPLNSLFVSYTQVSDLSALANLRLTCLHVEGTRVVSLAPLVGMPLRILNAGKTWVSDISVLRDMPLTDLLIHESRVRDVAPLKGLRLESLWFSPEMTTNGIDVIRSMDSLVAINRMSASEFWRKYDEGESLKSRK